MKKKTFGECSSGLEIMRDQFYKPTWFVEVQRKMLRAQKSLPSWKLQIPGLSFLGIKSTISPESGHLSGDLREVQCSPSSGNSNLTVFSSLG